MTFQFGNETSGLHNSILNKDYTRWILDGWTGKQCVNWSACVLRIPNNTYSGCTHQERDTEIRNGVKLSKKLAKKAKHRVYSTHKDAFRGSRGTGGLRASLPSQKSHLIHKANIPTSQHFSTLSTNSAHFQRTSSSKVNSCSLSPGGKS